MKLRLPGDAARLAALLAVRWRGERGLAALRQRKLRRLIDHAYARAPYYRARLDAAGVRPGDVATLDDLARVPVTTRDDLRRAGDAALAAEATGLATMYTSGSSGRPLAVRLSPGERRMRNLREFRALLRVGVRPRDRVAVLGPERGRPPRLHQRLGLYRLEVIPSRESVGEQVERLRRIDPTVLWAYPTALRSVLSGHGGRLSRVARPRVLITSAEVFDPVLRGQLLEDCPLEMFDFYGCAEVGRIAAECRAHRGLHVESDAVIVEILDGDRPAAPGSPGRAVVTALDQYAMPIIRYDLGDALSAAAGPCPCGWPTPTLDVSAGRMADMVAVPGGGGRSAFRLTHTLRTEADLRQFRFVQERPDRLEALLAYGSPPPPEHLAGVRRRLEAALDGEVRVDIRLLDEIPRDGLKFRVVVSSLPSGSAVLPACPRPAAPSA